MRNGHSPDSPTTVAICVPTFRRPQGLRKLLQSLAEISVEGLGNVRPRLVVVDNDVDGSAGSVVAEWHGRWPLDYVVEPRRGEPYARNLAVDRASDAELIAFIDDDEWADSEWLAELVKTQRESCADIVLGPVIPRFAVPPSSWLERGGYFGPLQFPPNSRLHFAYGGNVLVRASVFQDLRFSERYVKLGGVDTHLFMRAHLAGRTIVWSPGARVFESIPPERMRLGWLVRREFRRGNTLSLCLLELEASPWRLLKRCVHGSLRAGLGAAYILLAVVRGRVAFARGLREAAFGVGLLAGLLKYEYQEYP